MNVTEQLTAVEKNELMEDCSQVDLFFTGESFNLSSILNIESRMSSRQRSTVKSMRTETAAIVS